MAKNILVTGYTGRLGQLVATELRDDYSLQPSVLLRPGRLSATQFEAPANMRVVSGDYDEPESLRAAVKDRDAIFLVSPVHPQMVRRELALARAAARMPDPPHIVKISGLGTRLDSFVDSGRWHAEIEAGIRQLGVPATFLRPNFFMQNLAFQAHSIREHGILRGATEDAQIAMIDARDIAAVAAAVLAGGNAIESMEVSLTCERSYNYDEVAAALSKAFDTTVTYQRQTTAQLDATLRGAGQPDWHRKILLAFNEAFIAGWGADTTDAVARALGRPPRTLESFLEELAAGSSVSGINPFPS